MGIYDRDYYRPEGSRGFSSFSDRGQMCKWLIGINVVMFVIQLVAQDAGSTAVTDALALDPAAVLHGQVWRLLTYAFLHDPTIWQHIVFNMLFLWWFGADVEDLYGPKEFLAIYLVSAVVGGVVFTLTSLTPVNGGICLGASGAVTAVMVLCALHYPRKIILLFFVIPIPIWLFVGFNVAQDAFMFINRQRTEVAVAVHLGGALFAFGYYKQHWQLVPYFMKLQRWFKERRRPPLRVYREEPPEALAMKAAPATETDEPFEEKLDRVLEKVASAGQQSLTEGERRILLRASEIYRKRRS
jgi:membrane associated rhomboid family serine protease